MEIVFLFPTICVLGFRSQLTLHIDITQQVLRRFLFWTPSYFYT